VYARAKATLSARARDTLELDAAIREEFGESGSRYGSPRIHRVLRGKGRKASRKRVARRMQVLGLRARRPKRFRKTTEANAKHVPAPNILDRRFLWEQPNQAWVGDITYVWTFRGWAYLALLVDLCTRRIVGWSVSEHCDTALALQALQNAVARHRPGPGLLHHTDRGATYTAGAYRRRLHALGMVASMSRKGECWDNAVAESTIGTVKIEALGDAIPADIHELRTILFPYIEGFYNRRRLHSTLGYMSPADRESSLTLATKVA